MLIVNADDLGRNRVSTDRTLACHAKRRVSSASAMVFMEDSERAAELAIAAGIDVGLHINFTEPFTQRSIPDALRKSQERLCSFLRSSKYALLIYNPAMRPVFRNVFDAQREEFVRIYKREPSHLDGHQHMHLATNMLVDEILPKGTKVRRSFWFAPGEKNFINRLYRSAVDRQLARRHRLADYFLALPHKRSPDARDRVFGLARKFNVEFMTHPERPDELEFLMGDEFGRLLSQLHVAGYDAL